MLSRCIYLFLLFSIPAAFAGVPGQHEGREGDEIIVAGQFFHSGTKVVLWLDPGGYDAYRVERRFGSERGYVLLAAPISVEPIFFPT